LLAFVSAKPAKDGAPQVIQMMRKEAYRLAGWQLLVTAIVSLLMGLIGGYNWSFSAAVGGVIAVVTNLWQALRMTRLAGQEPEKFLGGLYISEFIKAVLTVALFIVAIKTLGVELVPTISGFGVCFVVHLAVVKKNFLPADPAVLEANRIAREQRGDDESDDWD